MLTRPTARRILCLTRSKAADALRGFNAAPISFVFRP